MDEIETITFKFNIPFFMDFSIRSDVFPVHSMSIIKISRGN